MIKFSRTLRILRIRFPFQWVVLFLPLLLSGCALFSSQENVDRSLSHREKTFKFVDKAGEFILSRESGYIRKKNRVVVKRKLSSQGESDKPLEKSITISNLGFLKEVKILRPSVSQYAVWFDGKKYFTEMSLNEEEKKLEIKMQSPEKKWQGKKLVSFPDGNGLYCFFSQIAECAQMTGFISLSKKKKSGVMNFHIIWEGYPYIHEQYPPIPNDVFTPARLKYDGKNDEGLHRYSLDFADQTLFYMLNDKGRLAEIYWVAQGISVTGMEQ